MLAVERGRARWRTGSEGAGMVGSKAGVGSVGRNGSVTSGSISGRRSASRARLRRGSGRATSPPAAIARPRRPARRAPRHVLGRSRRWPAPRRRSTKPAATAAPPAMPPTAVPPATTGAALRQGALRCRRRSAAATRRRPARTGERQRLDNELGITCSMSRPNVDLSQESPSSTQSDRPRALRRCPRDLRRVRRRRPATAQRRFGP